MQLRGMTVPRVLQVRLCALLAVEYIPAQLERDRTMLSPDISKCPPTHAPDITSQNSQPVLLLDPFQAEEILQMVKILMRCDECSTEYVRGSGNPKVVFAHVSGGHALWEGESRVM